MRRGERSQDGEADEAHRGAEAEPGEHIAGVVDSEDETIGRSQEDAGER